MEIEQTNRLRIAGFVVLTGALVLILAGCAAMLVIATRAAALADPHTKRVLARLAWLAAAILGLALLLLLWAVMRFVANRIRPRGQRTPTAYVNAWAVAGQRFKLQEADEEQDEGDQDDLPQE